MIESKDLNEKFYLAYHNPDLLQAMHGIKAVIREAGPQMLENQHAIWLRETCNRLEAQHANHPEHELPGMLYGMLYSAWNKFLQDYEIQYQLYQKDIRDRGQQVIEHAPMLYFWLVERAWEFFIDQADPMSFLTNADLLREISYVVEKEARERGKTLRLELFTPEMTLLLLNAARNGLSAHKMDVLALAQDHIQAAILGALSDLLGKEAS